ncbi:3-carboxy-cis,cis-muconate cycloisomerase [Peteryoungia desertarenae]|uniref:3-carboxy-cis,cis-muconate cycloisomerase n=1 Tax=Peteryoungia desertarenae TaxID=1813451 RepID=A0ABX6QIP0_9HYPH|nr:3-carboxy-cis,cis-muconate cycloisomerase [Peteryoungia desertarenae]QLF68429.1 3-carboxy-cis,cis-muconate cycloisomerase [Peteryoungia desertarenae]
MTVGVFDHPVLAGLLGDESLYELFTVEAELAAMLAFEVALAQAQAAFELIPNEAADAIARLPSGFAPDVVLLRQAIGSDGVVIPELVRQWREALGEHAPHVHFGATSQDAIDTGLMLRLKPALSLIAQRLLNLIAELAALKQRHGHVQLMGRTRMQAALPILAGDRIASWQDPLADLDARLRAFRETGLPLQLGGAVGTLEKLGDKAAEIRADVARRLELADHSQWHSQRTVIADLGHLVSLITGSLGKFGQDIALMADNGSVRLSGGGASSAMPHKRNPVKAEVLVTLARFNAVQLSGLHHSLVHEQERSGAAWTLEWMILPQMVVACGGALKLGLDLAQSIESMGDAGH